MAACLVGSAALGGADATRPRALAEEEAAGEDNSEREQLERPAADAAPRRRVLPRGGAAALILVDAFSRAAPSSRIVASLSAAAASPTVRRVRCGFLQSCLERAACVAATVLSCLSAGSAVLGRSGSAVVFSGSPSRTYFQPWTLVSSFLLSWCLSARRVWNAKLRALS